VPGPGYRKCTPALYPGPGALPTVLRFSDGLGSTVLTPTTAAQPLALRRLTRQETEMTRLVRETTAETAHAVRSPKLTNAAQRRAECPKRARESSLHLGAGLAIEWRSVCCLRAEPCDLHR